MTDNSHYDIIIVGGGLVGASLACALGGQRYRVGVVEAVPYGADGQPSYDERSVALAWGSRRIFEGLGVWQALAGEAAPIRRIHVSDRGHFGFARLDAQDYGVEALGYVLANRVLGKVLGEAMARMSNVELLCPAQVLHVAIGEQAASVAVKQQGAERTLSAALVVGADGDRSKVRQLVGIERNRWDYGRHAVIANVTPGRYHDNIAYERFTADGPLAMLPLSDGRCGLVWTVPARDVDTVLALDGADFLRRVQDTFGGRLGRLKQVGVRRAYPLTLIQAREAVHQRAVLIGNAAHSVAPVAGQGFNLGLRDVAALAQVFTDAARGGADPGSRAVLQEYLRWRAQDQERVIGFTDGLMRVFSSASPPLVAARDIGLLALDVVPPLKRALMRQTMGLAGRLPRLARGLPL